MNDVKRILITGNGFDLFHDLPTSYKDFMDVINRLLELNQNNKKANYLLYIFGDSKNNDVYKNNENIRNCYKTYGTKMKNIELNKENLNKMINIANNNYWFQYFNSCLKNDNMAWIDFEKEIRFVLENFQDFFKVVTKISDENLRLDRIIFKLSEFDIKTRIVINEFDFFTVEKDKEHITREKVNISKEYCEVRFSNNNNQIIGVDVTRIYQYLIKELDDFSDLFELYIIEFINNISLEKGKKDRIFENVDAVITFNYTDTYKNIYNNEKVIPIEYMHGHAGDNNIVLGINSDKYDNLETLDENFIPFKKEYKRILNGNLFRYRKFIPAFGKIEFIFFGHSLDITDKDILNDLIIGFPKARHIIYCYNDEAKESYIKNLFKLFGKDEVEKLIEDDRIEFRNVFEN